MAGDWIKMRCDLHDDPAVIGIAFEMGMDEADVVGRLHKIWCWADRQTVDGNASSVTSAFVDRLTHTPGFAKAMQNQGWLVVENGGIRIPNFNRHNGKSAKNRALGTIRQNAFRNANGNAPSVTSALPEKRREEKRREEVNANTKPPTPFPAIPGSLDCDEFAAAWKLWLTHRKEKRQPITPTSAAQQLKKLATMGLKRAIEALEHSIANGWTGVFEPSERKAANATKPSAGQRYDPNAPTNPVY
jgi:hypothetical protein